MAAKLYRVVGPNFVAGFLTSDTGLSIQDSAPILKWFRGKSMVFAVNHCNSRGWTLELLDGDDPCRAGLLDGPYPAE